MKNVGAFPQYSELVELNPPRKMPNADRDYKGIIVRTEVKDSMGEGVAIEGSFVEFINVGQTGVWLNNSVPILPGGGYYVMANPYFQATWEFYTVNAPPAVDGKTVQAGNQLKIRIYKKSKLTAFSTGFVDLKQPAANVSIGSVNITPPTAGALTDDQGYTTTVPTIPANPLRVFIKNVGTAVPGGGGAIADIVVNGDNIAVGQERLFEAILDPVTQIFKYPSVTVVNASGAGIYFEIDS